MGPSRPSLKRMLLLATFVALCLFATTARAQDTTAADSDDDDTATTIAADEAEDTTTTEAAAEATTEATAEETTETVASTTGTADTTTASDASDLPTLTGIYNTYSYPAPSVPPTANAPFMQTSSLPDGTVFIALGAILGAFGAAVLIWRGVVACLLHRSVEKAAAAQHVQAGKTFPAPPSQFYKYSDQESKISIAGTRRNTRGPIPPSGTPSQTNLFFSPTAPGQGHQPRDSRASFLPNGFYPANGGGSSPQGGLGHQPSISLTNLRPSSRGQVASFVGPSPPDSPSFGPNRSTPALRNASSISLNQPPSQRAPSAYLEDLLDENPHMFPPQGGSPLMPPQPSQQGQPRL